jgi:cytosine deaminase
MNINFFMDKALKQANKALLVNEVPIGAVLVDNNTKEIIVSTHNLINSYNNSTFHAEILAINKSCQKRKSKFLNGTTLFVTLEPCAMCAAAISEVHIDRVYFGAYDEKKGSLDSIMKIYNKKNYFVPEVYGGISEDKCSFLLKSFFQRQRIK